MKTEILKLIANWQNLIQEKDNKDILVALFQKSNQIKFSKVSFAENPCFKNDLVTLHFGVSDDHKTLYWILLRASQNNLDAIFLKDTKIYVEEFKEEIDRAKKPLISAEKASYKYEQITEEEAQNRILSWNKNKTTWLASAQQELPRYALIPSANFDQTADYVLNLALKPFMQNSHQLDMVIRNVTNGVYADAVRVVPPCRPRPFWWD